MTLSRFFHHIAKAANVMLLLLPHPSQRIYSTQLHQTLLYHWLAKHTYTYIGKLDTGAFVIITYYMWYCVTFSSCIELCQKLCIKKNKNTLFCAEASLGAEKIEDRRVSLPGGLCFFWSLFWDDLCGVKIIIILQCHKIYRKITNQKRVKFSFYLFPN